MRAELRPWIGRVRWQCAQQLVRPDEIRPRREETATQDESVRGHCDGPEIVRPPVRETNHQVHAGVGPSDAAIPEGEVVQSPVVVRIPLDERLQLPYRGVFLAVPAVIRRLNEIAFALARDGNQIDCSLSALQILLPRPLE